MKAVSCDQRKRGHKGLGPRSPTGPCMAPCILTPLIDCSLFAKTSIIALNSSGWERLLSSWKCLHLCMRVCPLSCVRLFDTLWTATHQAPLSMEFSRQAHLGGLSFPTPKDLPDPGIEPTLSVYQLSK